MGIVYPQNSGQIAGKQTGGGTEKHHKHHIKVSENGLPLEQGLQTHVGMRRMKLFP